MFEIPTGIVADVRSRKLSIVIGFLGTGIAFIVLGFAGSFAVAALSQVMYGVSATFVSGADVAWLTDEVGESAARPLYLRSEQFYNVGSLVGIVGSVTLASTALPMPIVAAGIGYVALGLALVLVMRETPRPRGRSTRSFAIRCARRCAKPFGRFALTTSCSSSLPPRRCTAPPPKGGTDWPTFTS